MKNDGFIRLIRLGDQARALATIFVAVVFAFQDPVAFAQAPPAASPETGQTANYPPDKLDSMVAPIALYPDPLLSQILVASTYPLEVVEAARWVKQNPNLKGSDLTAAAAKQPWDPSVQALVVFPEVLAMMDQNIGWTTDLGNAFLAQESSVLDAVQRLRQEARADGKLRSTPQQTVNTAAGGTNIQIEPASPEVIYVPQYQPAEIWGPAPAYYPYPSVVYPSTGALIATGALAFGTGILVGGLISPGWGWGGWGWNVGWGGRTIFVNNNFIRHNRFNPVVVHNGNRWSHSPVHRRAVPYGSGAAGRFRPGTPMNPIRPTPGQTQQRLGGAERGVGPGAMPRPGGPAMGPGGSPIRPGQRLGEQVAPPAGQRPAQRPGQGMQPGPGQRPGQNVAPIPGQGQGQRPGPGAIQPGQRLGEHVTPMPRPGQGSAQRPAPVPNMPRPNINPGARPMPQQAPTMPRINPQGGAQRMMQVPHQMPRMTPGPRSMPRTGPGRMPGGHFGGRRR